jgi:histidinol phosphatase-like enzyme
MSKVIVKVEIRNKQLDALEDLLYCKLTKKEEEDARKQVIKLWHSLIDAYEKGKEKK